MAITSDKDEKKYSDDIKKNLAQLGGLGAGALLGVGASYPLDSRYQKKLVNQSIEDTQLQKHSEKRWRNLFKLYEGTMSLDDLPASERETYEKLLQANKDELNHLSHRPEAKRDALKNLTQGRVIPINGDSKTSITKHFPYKVKHPASGALVGLAAIAGGYGASSLYEHFNEPNSDKKSFYRF